MRPLTQLTRHGKIYGVYYRQSHYEADACFYIFHTIEDFNQWFRTPPEKGRYREQLSNSLYNDLLFRNPDRIYQTQDILPGMFKEVKHLI